MLELQRFYKIKSPSSPISPREEVPLSDLHNNLFRALARKFGLSFWL